MNIWDTSGGKLSSFTENKIYPILLSFMYKNDKMMDMKYATDLLAQYDKSNSFALRIRRPLTTQFNPTIERDSMTIRYCGRGGNPLKSELHKIRTLSKDKLPKFGFYGFMDNFMLGVGNYVIYDIHELQDYLNKNEKYLNSAEFFEKRIRYNKDGSAFVRFHWDRLPNSVVVEQGKWSKDIEYLNGLITLLHSKSYYDSVRINLKYTLENIAKQLENKK